MAIYHLEAKVVSRGAGRSAVAASAYLSCSRLYNDYDGIQHDYTKKQGLVWQKVFLPEYAPQEWQDRKKLWNAVEEVETAKDSRLAREFVVALPIELSREEQIELLQEFIQEQFLSDGMCADAAIHDTDGHNPHAHILLTVRMDKSLLLGFITREGSSNSHTAILARSMNIPALIQCKDIQDDWDGKMAVVDGYNACVYVDPTPDLLKSLKKRQQEDQKKQALLQELKGKPNTTLDGKTINVFANIGGMGDVGAVQQNDAGGVGLFRTEFVYLNCKDFPTEDYQFEAYKQVLESLAPRKVVVRTCDIGADKTVDYMKLDHEDNPALGYRAIRICLTRKDFFKTQLRALLRASAYGNMSIMFPMITSLRELQDAKAVLEECRAELTAEGVKMGQNIEVGTMIETPAAVLIADELAQECDFFSIGTNDLTQYTCALDRQNAKLEPFFNPHHPAVLRAIKMTIEAGHRHGIWVGICGELGADTALTETFLRMGVDELSMNAKSILPVRKIIRSVDLSKPSEK